MGQDGRATLYIGDVRKVLASLPERSVDCVITSPPFFRQRGYLDAGHPDKGLEVGTELTPADYVDVLLDVTEMLLPVLTSHGSFVFEIGDSTAGSGGAGGDYNDGGFREGQNRWRGTAAARNEASRVFGPGVGFPRDKGLCLTPEMFRFALTYGYNPGTPCRECAGTGVVNGESCLVCGHLPPGRGRGQRQVSRVVGRNVLRWYRPNPAVGRIVDRWRPATSDMFFALPSGSGFVDLDAARVPATMRPQRRRFTKPTESPGGVPYPGKVAREEPGVDAHPLGAPPHDTLIIPTEGFDGDHFAVWPSALVRSLLTVLCPERVCVDCGVPWQRRVVCLSCGVSGGNVLRPFRCRCENRSERRWERSSGGNLEEWVPCGCGSVSWRRGVVLDPFSGSGTTLAVAVGMGRSAVGIDLNETNVRLAAERVGHLFLDVVDTRGQNTTGSESSSDRNSSSKVSSS